ncbi:MAG: DNA polymerase IV [Pseudomonadota bacterium]|nr:DNA polymerase IV [Pseudomonadota bacterium]
MKNTPAAHTLQAIILHLDMDAFFASVEQADDPALRGLPVVVGDSPRGVVSAASYEARKYGVHSAMPIARARKLCPQAVFLPGRMFRYREVSRQVMALIRTHCPVVEQASVDEAYADISGMERILPSPEILAGNLKKAIRDSTGLSCSIGIAPNKFLAKIASAWRKPDGLTVISPEAAEDFLRDLPVTRIPGVGRRMREELHLLGAVRIRDVLTRPREFWTEALGKRGNTLYDRSLGVDPSPVVPYAEAQSCSAENTFVEDTADPQILEHWLLVQAERVGAELRALGKKGATITLKIRFQDFSLITRSKTLSRPTDITREIHETARRLLAGQKLAGKVRLIGLGVSNFRSGKDMLPLLTDARREREEHLDRTMDRIRARFGAASIVRADAVHDTEHVVRDTLSLKNRKPG